MGLRAKFNLVMVLALLAGLGVAGGLAWNLVHRDARDQVLVRRRS